MTAGQVDRGRRVPPACREAGLPAGGWAAHHTDPECRTRLSGSRSRDPFRAETLEDSAEGDLGLDRVGRNPLARGLESAPGEGDPPARVGRRPVELLTHALGPDQAES